MRSLLPWLPVFSGWFSILFFVSLTAYRFRRIARMPLNLRWEVYPVPHETGERRPYGGSYMEQTDWSRKRCPSSRLAELAEMGAEIFFLNRLRRHNPFGLWPFSLAMHWGLYLTLLWIVLLAAAHETRAFSPAIVAVGLAGLVPGLYGTLGLLVKRMTNRELSMYTTTIDYFHLIFLATIFGLGFISWAADPTFKQHQAYIVSVISFRPVAASPLTLFLFFLLQALVVYMPFSKLIHYVMKHFTFTEILWDDVYKRKDSAKDRQIARQLSFSKDWSAAHMGRDKTWLQDARETSGSGENGR